MNWITTSTQAHNAIAEALNAGTAPSGLPVAQLLEHGTMKVYFYEPRGTDKQPTHKQDEVYVVVTGSGTFAIGSHEDDLERIPFGPGDAIFTPAGAIHRFENFTDDFSAWVIMWGPLGGERSHP
ncbi:MAG: cupin domain-containing protein [Leptolyngbya sp. SIO1D8]|nr:cupin domain-containing protein [Leptolyngbya sp. SIO1D8]